ncbi:hypothetical protein DES53_109243 [Roseimicrobium gellanilyticum]|uniref:Uncharacterized protein n=1 Tax=Roseimicrobium gellanilyticum TaxID=748857 RepID=A0A366HDL1_9BACT|nr:hypothetical protein [Roseimicrobium gellanilyticum]RBP39815.1 hypothetical protein DES53_109243 [Roseimicrobium gellanilyticum]
MKVERCPHCKNRVLFAGDYCSHCRKHRVTGELMAAEEMNARLGDARKVASMRTAHDQEAINQEGRLKTVCVLALIAGVAVTLSGLGAESPFIAVVGVAMFLAGAQLYLRHAVKFMALFLMLSSGSFLLLRLWELVGIFSQAGLMIAGTLPMWVIWSGLFLILMVTSFKIVVHNPDKNTTPPAVPDGPPVSAALKQSSQQAGDKT